MKKTPVFLDTSAVLAGELKNHDLCYISPITLSELEHIKTSERSDYIKYHAREAVRDILQGANIVYTTCNQREVDKLLKKYNFLSNINDHRLICEAVLTARDEGYDTITFITNDAAQSVLAQRVPVINAYYLENREEQDHSFCGWTKYYPNDEDMSILYSDPTQNVLNCKINEFAEIYDKDNKLQDVLFWDGKQYANLKYKDIKNPYIGETIKPRNLEQKMAFHILQNQDIKVKLLTSAWGSGKTMIALNYALE